MYKINEAMRIIDYIRNSPDFFNMLDLIWKMDTNPVDKWKNFVQPLLSTVRIVIQKPTERPATFDDLSGSEYTRRLAQRSCHLPLCEKKHCNECDKCEHKVNDGHLCRCPVCGVEYISRADGEEHNLEGECKESSEEE